MWGSPLKHHYRIDADNVSLKQFIRSIFLVFAAGASYTEGHFPDVTVAEMEYSYYIDHGFSSQMKAIYRFRMPNNEKVEIELHFPLGPR